MIRINLQFLKKKRFWKRFFFITLTLPILIFSIAIIVVYYKQDQIVQELIKSLNENFVGTLKIKDSHIAPFANFPYISVDLEDLEVYEGKEIEKKFRKNGRKFFEKNAKKNKKNFSEKWRKFFRENAKK